MKPENGRLRGVGRALLIALAGGLAATAALPLIPAVRHDLGPTTVSARARLGSGSTIFVAPPLGTISAATHTAPVELEVALNSIDVAALEDQLVAGRVPKEMIVGVEKDLRSLATRLVVQIGLGSLVIALLLAALLPRRRIGNFVAAGCGGLLAAAIAATLTLTTFDQQAFEEPKFSGALARAPEVIEALDRGGESFASLSSRYEILAGRISEVLTLAAEPQEGFAETSVAILHVSDIHSNFVGLEITKRLARAFQVEAVIDTGDLTSFGQPLEARVGQLLNNLDVPYYFIPGNHDSQANQSSLDRISQIELVDQDTVDIEGIDVLGWGDPTFTADNETSTEEANERRDQEAVTVAEAVAGSSPDILAVHDARLAEQSIGQVPLVIAGHRHERAFEQREGTTILTVGSTGATGLGSFLVESDLPYEAEVIYLQDGVPQAVDYISFFGLGEEFEVDRQIIDEASSSPVSS